MKETYLDLIEMAANAYTREHVEEYTRQIEREGLREHGYPRLTANIGTLLTHGRKQEWLDLFPHMMDLCCTQIPIARNNTDSAGNDFSVKEIVFCLLEVEKAGTFPETMTRRWREQLAGIQPMGTYSCISGYPPERIGNWAAFAAASEQTRIFAGIGHEEAFIENQIQSQLLSFDENGMYRDPHEPMVYDAVTRLQLAIALVCGYNGKGRAALEEALLKSAIPTLRMQSITGEIPFGGRSNQFLHNETFYAALCEFYAGWMKARGEMTLAGQFKDAAALAAEGVQSWLVWDETHHIKNRFPLDSHIGCEGYGYFNKYMITMGSWAYLAFRLADDSIERIPCPARTGGYSFRTSPYFHKLFLNAGGYAVEYDLKADPHYDASGLGRIHKNGVPSALGLSIPFAQEPYYQLPGPNPGPMSVCGGVIRDDREICGCDLDASYSILSCTADSGNAAAGLRWSVPGMAELTEMCEVKEDGVTITVSGDEPVFVNIPVFTSDGETASDIQAEENRITAVYRGHSAIWTTSGKFVSTGRVYCNRNGLYTLWHAVDKKTVSIHITLQ